MEHTDQRLGSEPCTYGLCDEFAILHEVGNCVMQSIAHRVPSVIPDVVDEEVKLVQQPGPQRKVEVRCQAVAVAEEDARTTGVSVPPHDYHLAVMGGQFHNL